MNKQGETASAPIPGRKSILPPFLLLLLAGLVMIAAAFLVVGTIQRENVLVERNAHYLCLDCLGIG